MSEASNSIENMATQEEDLTEELHVAEFLQSNPKFFERHRELLSLLSVPHESGGSTSLIERQVAALREENADLKRKLSTFVSHAQNNDHLWEKTKTLILSLIESQSFSALRDCIERAMVDDFNATQCRLWGIQERNSQADSLDLERSQLELARLIEHPRAFCGLLKEDESQLLFGEQADQVGSAAVIPLFSDDQLIAILAIANEDRDYYRDNMSTSLLSYIGDVLTNALEKSQE